MAKIPAFPKTEEALLGRMCPFSQPSKLEKAVVVVSSQKIVALELTGAEEGEYTQVYFPAAGRRAVSCNFAIPGKILCTHCCLWSCLSDSAQHTTKPLEHPIGCPPYRDLLLFRVQEMQGSGVGKHGCCNSPQEKC